jgi:tetratricopeptide (TPR) repeat protein
MRGGASTLDKAAGVRFRDPLSEEREPTGEDPMSLSVCLITRNEQFSLPRVLRSVAGVADQLIVADTGSTDQTVSLARQHGATVCEFAWDDDFAAARNFALDQATGDWILWLNPDEEVLPESQPLLREALARAEALAYQVVVQELRQPDRLDFFTETFQTRLFRRRPELRFVGRVHPQFRTAVEELARREGKKVFGSAIAVRHFAFLSVPTEPKLRWAARLLERELQEHPDQFSTLIHYGKTLLRLNDPAGHAVLARAASQLLPFLPGTQAPFPDTHLLLEYLMTVAPEQSQGSLSREDAWDLARRWFPASPPLLWIRAAQRFGAGDYRSAAELLETLIRLGQTGTYDREEPFSPDIIGADALMNLGACYTHLGQFDRAEACFRQLLESQSHRSRAVDNLLRVQNARRQAEQSSDGYDAGGFEPV